MKTLKYCMVAAMVAAMVALAGCGAHSRGNQSSTTNSVSVAQPSTKNMINNNPAVGMTKTPVTTNGLGSDVQGVENNMTVEMKTEPQVALGSGTHLSGLFIDCVTPRETWGMLNPSVPARDLPEPIPPYLLPVTAPSPINDPTVHQLDFALFRLSFP